MSDIRLYITNIGLHLMLDVRVLMYNVIFKTLYLTLNEVEEASLECIGYWNKVAARNGQARPDSTPVNSGNTATI